MKRATSHTLTVVVPVYEEASTVDEALANVLGVSIPGIEIDVVVVESNSRDGTREKVLGLASGTRVTVVLQDQARGKGNAVRLGLERATGDIVLIQDADLEYDVNDYARLLEPICDGRADFVLGSRHDSSKPMREMDDARLTGSVMNVGHVVFSGVFNLIYGVHLRDPFTMYKVFRRSCLDSVRLECDRFDFDWELVGKMVRLGYVPLEIPVSYKSRSFSEGKKVRLFRDPLTWLLAAVKYRVQPVSRFYVPESP